nr:hypothetical protein [Tanacetum cinerariifolium]
METFVLNDEEDYYSGSKNITFNVKNAYELRGKFFDDLYNNAFSGTNRKDAVEHIEYYLKIIDPIRLPNVDHDRLRIVVYSISLTGGTKIGIHVFPIPYTGPHERNIDEYWWRIYKSGDLEVLES